MASKSTAQKLGLARTPHHHGAEHVQSSVMSDIKVVIATGYEQLKDAQSGLTVHHFDD